MMKRCFLIIIIILSLQNGYGQKFELGKVSVSELEEKAHPLDSSAAAAVLYNKKKTSVIYTDNLGIYIEHIFEIRIKIYKKEGLDFANYEVPYRVKYSNLKPDVLTVSDAVTYNLVNGKVEKTKLSNDGKFDEKESGVRRTVTIALPNVKVGSVIEFRYIHKSENILSFPTFIFQRDIPVNFAEYHTEIPVYYTYKAVLKGFLKPETKSEVENAYQSTVMNAGLGKDRLSLK
jgi:hypothetical protein